jgi:cytochrome c peroxidase
MALPATTATAVVWLNTDPVYAKEAAASSVDLKKVRDSLTDLIESDESKRGDGTSLKGTFIRLAWHSSGTYKASDNSGGSDGAKMRYSPESEYGNNAGLGVARNALEPIKTKFPELSYADLYTYAGVVSVEESGGPNIPFRLGRSDADEATAKAEADPYDRLPDADKGSLKSTTQHVRDVLGRMGFTDREIVALLGAHAMGRCHTDRSGYWGPW